MKYQKIKKILFTLLLIPTSALANEINLNCPPKANSGTTITCDIHANITENSIDEVKFLYKDISIPFEKFTPEDNWRIEQGGTNLSTGIVLIRNDEVSGITKLGTITYQLPDQQNDMTIMIYGFDATNTSAQVINFSNSTSSANIHINKTNNFLKSLLINGNDIGFNKNKLDYQYTTTSSTAEISAELDDISATCNNLARTVNLVNGNNIIEYKVIAENGSSKIYTINIIYIEQIEPEIKPNPNPNEPNNGSNNNENNSNNDNQSINNSNNNANNSNNDNQSINNSNNNTNDIIENDQNDEKNNEETIIEKEENEKKEEIETNDEEKNQITESQPELKNTNNKKKILNALLIIISILSIIVSIVLVKKNWSILYKNDEK